MSVWLIEIPTVVAGDESLRRFNMMSPGLRNWSAVSTLMYLIWSRRIAVCAQAAEAASASRAAAAVRRTMFMAALPEIVTANVRVRPGQRTRTDVLVLRSRYH